MFYSPQPSPILPEVSEDRILFLLEHFRVKFALYKACLRAHNCLRYIK